MSIYEEKMPAYLAMSRGDLIAEILAADDLCQKWLADHIASNHELASTPEVQAAKERIRIANNVLEERFNLELMTNGIEHFHPGDEDF